MESSSTSFSRDVARSEVDILSVLKKYPIKSSFGGQKCKPKEVLSFISIIEDLFISRYKDSDKIKL